MQIPSVIMSLHIETTPSTTIEMPQVEAVHVEMSREALETMIDGLGKIRDQLSAMK
jgi:COMM domain containing 9